MTPLPANSLLLFLLPELPAEGEKKTQASSPPIPSEVCPWLLCLTLPLARRFPSPLQPPAGEKKKKVRLSTRRLKKNCLPRSAAHRDLFVLRLPPFPF